ncbi:MAG TPA: fibronectin type III domain-containing protein [Candidatus Bathyarchaeia archaeon]|nr:fibronectin type III domain-containing protein [Candidatus Bathyarchaeia archaeon]
MMGAFPLSEAEIVALAERIAAGLEAHPGLFPSPPVDPAALRARRDAFSMAQSAAVTARVAARMATLTKDESLDALRVDMKQVLRYAESLTHMNDEKLGCLGWSAPHARQRIAPGQPGLLTIVREGDGWLLLRWHVPEDGGHATVYRIERRLDNHGDWDEAGSALHPEITLEKQPRGPHLEYRVVAVNNSGESVPSNTVTAVL